MSEERRNVENIQEAFDKEFERFVQRMSDMEGMFPPLQDGLNRIWNLERERAKLYRERYHALLMEFDTGTNIPTTPVTTPVVKAGSNGSNGNGS